MTARMLALIAVLLAVVPATRAYASCNAVPERPPLFFGERGSIDRPLVSPDSDETVVLGPGSTAETLPESRIAPKDLLITIVFRPPQGASRTFYIAGNDRCEPLEEHACFLERLFCRPPKACFTGSAVGLKVRSGGRISFGFPSTGFAGPVTIAVSLPDQKGHNPAPLWLRKQRCSALRSSQRSNVIICIDDFQPLDDPPGTPSFPALLALPPSYDYQTVCTEDDGSAPPCYGTATDVAYTTDSDGNLSIPVRWENVLQGKGTADNYYQRNMRASMAVEAVLGRGNRIFIPSPVFLETTSLQGGGFSPSPEFVPEELSGRRNEQTVRGTADRGKSNLKFWRRKQWDHACNGGPNQGQACELPTAGSDCPSAQCLPVPAAYFACFGGGIHDKLPCTRSAQCPPQGACRRVQDTGSMCVAFNGVPTGTPCKEDTICGLNATCGPGLFEFRDRIVNGQGTLKRIATKARGICDGGPKSGNVCTQSSACGSANCVTYRAAALAYTTPVPTPTP